MWTRRSPEALLALALLLACASASAADDAGVDRARIARERAAVEAQARQAERDCAQRFVVSPCVTQARAERRSRLQSLERQSALLDEAQRRSRAADRLERLRQRQAAASAAPPIVAKPARVPRAQAAPASAADSGLESALDSAPGAPARRAAAAERSAAEQRDAAQRALARERRARAAAAHREAVEQRNDERRLATRKPSVPLPPGGAPASAPR